MNAQPPPKLKCRYCGSTAEHWDWPELVAQKLNADGGQVDAEALRGLLALPVPPGRALAGNPGGSYLIMRPPRRKRSRRLLSIALISLGVGAVFGLIVWRYL